MSAATPGPWLFDGPDMFGDFNILHNADALAVAAVVSNMREPGEVAANARLIAAAPEGFDIIEQLEESFTADATYVQFLPAMRAYLAKVRGGYDAHP